MPVGPGVGGHRGVAAARSGLTWSLPRAPSEYSGDLGAEQVGGGALELEHVEQVAVVGDVAAEPSGGGEGQVGDAVPGGQVDAVGGTGPDLLLGGGRQVRRLG